MPYCEECGHAFLGAGRFCDKCLLSINEPVQKTGLDGQIGSHGYGHPQERYPDPYNTNPAYQQYGYNNPYYSSQYQYSYRPIYPQPNYNQYNLYQYYPPLASNPPAYIQQYPIETEQTKAENMATIGIILSIVGFVFFIAGVIIGILGMLFGYIAFSRGARKNGALAMIIGIFAVLLNAFLTAFIFWPGFFW